ncbi:hypothetical protein QFC21_000370 [Naganishia friedmannii]|uniref:Uncharacterized protein n=1 Tax=Naganishia friedmannii TaxID=89922 RepID=A0ACC2WBA4_9TREE|nr:hypothetical protein QFC21_000370 [Naganishia friedmannii]
MEKMENLVNYETSGENSPFVTAPQPPLKPSVPDVPIVSISIKGAGTRSTSGQHTPPASSSGTAENKTPVKIQIPTKVHSFPRRPPTPSVPFSKGLESRGGFNVLGASNAVSTRETVKPTAPELEDGEEGEVEEGEAVTMREGPTQPVSVVVAELASGESIRLTAVSPSTAFQTHSVQSTERHVHKLREDKRRSRPERSPSPPRRSSSRPRRPATETRDVKWAETVEKAQSRKAPAVTNMDESHQRFRPKGSSGRSEKQRSPTRSSSRPARTAGSSPNRDDSGGWSSSHTEGWRLEAEGKEPRGQRHDRLRRMSPEGDSYDLNRLGRHPDRKPQQRGGLDYGTSPVASVDTRGPRDHRSRDIPYRYDRSDNRSDYSQTRQHIDRHDNYIPASHYVADNGPGGYVSQRQPYTQDRRHIPSPESLNSRRHESTYNGRNRAPVRTSTYPENQYIPGRENANATSSYPASRDDPQGWNSHYPDRNIPQARYGAGQGRPEHQRPVERHPRPPHNEGQANRYLHQGSQDPTPGNDLGHRKNGSLQGQAQGPEHLSPRPERRALSPSTSREEYRQLKRSGSATLSPNDRFQNGSRSKKAKVEPEASLPPITTDVVMQSADSEVIPPPPRETPPEPPADEDIPAAPPSPASEMPVSHTNANQVEIRQALGDPTPSALQPENVTTTPIPPISFADNAVPAVTALWEPSVTEPLLVAPSSSEILPPPLKVPARFKIAPERVVSPLIASSLVEQNVKSPIPPPWSPNVPGPTAPGTVFRTNSPLPGQLSPGAPSITMQGMSSPPRAPTPNPNLTFSFLDYHTPAHSGNNTPLVNKTFFVRKKGERLDPKDDAAAYERQLIGVTKLDDFDMPTGNDKKEATLGKGTFGVVTRATRKADDRVVALKLLQPPEEAKGQGKAGVLGTTVREIKILKLLNHENIVPLLDIVIERDQAASAGDLKTFLVFPYMDHDLCGLLKNPKLEITDRLVKLYALQLLEGVAYMHHNNIVHRDLKSANILIDNQGLLQIADFGLARAVPSGPFECDDDLFMTNMVVTRWYRAPELFMGETQYGFEVDMWSVGCILSEMWTRRVLFMGRSDPDQLKLIFDLCGTPEQDYVRFETDLRQKEVINDNQGADSRKTIPVIEMASQVRKRILRDDSRYQHAKAEFKDLLDKFLQVNPAKRMSAADALNDRYFWVAPGPLPRSEVVHLNASKERRDQQEEAEAKERSREIERVQQQAQVSIQAHMVNNAVLASMPPRPHMQQPPTQLNASAYPMRNNNPYAQAAPTFYPQANMVVHTAMPPNAMPYPNAGSVPALNPYATQTTAAYPPHASLKRNGPGFVPNAHQPPGGNLPVHRNHAMQNNGGFAKSNQPTAAVNFRPKLKGNFLSVKPPPATSSQEQTQNQRPPNPDRFG